MEVVRLRRESGKVIQDCDVYIGRACYRGGWSLPQSIWYNPYSVKQYGRDKAVDLYEAYIRNNSVLLGRLEELKGKRLGCWCEPGERCHGKILINLLREKDGLVTINLQKKEKSVKLFIVEKSPKENPVCTPTINSDSNAGLLKVKLRVLPRTT